MKGVVDRFSEEFVETRMKALDKFLKRVADHPVLSFNPHLNAFLSAKVGRCCCLELHSLLHGWSCCHAVLTLNNKLHVDISAYIFYIFCESA